MLLFVYTMVGEDVWVSRCPHVKLNLSKLCCKLLLGETCFLETLDSVVFRVILERGGVESEIDHTVRARAKDPLEFETTIVDYAACKVRHNDPRFENHVV